MKPYRDVGGDSGVSAYEYGADWIHVQFETGALYEYTTVSAGRQNIDTMKQLADRGDGFNAFINKSVRRRNSCRVR